MSNHFFYQESRTLKQYKGWLSNFLSIMNRDELQTKIYLNIFDYFTKHPSKYEGNVIHTDKENLDAEVMLHDYLYLKLNAAANFRYKFLADKLMRKEMRKHYRSPLEIATRFWSMIVIHLFSVPYHFIVKRRKMSQANKLTFNKIYAALDI